MLTPTLGPLGCFDHAVRIVVIEQAKMLYLSPILGPLNVCALLILHPAKLPTMNLASSVVNGLGRLTVQV